MNLVVPPPVLPMLSKRAESLPTGAGWIFEPKWDGFRALVFRDGDEIFLQSRDEKPLLRYFPELAPPLKAQLPDKCVLDGEIVVAKDSGLDFEALQMRLHPAASRVKMLAEQIPTSIVFWDVLCVGDDDLRSLPFHERRKKLESLLAGAKPPVHLTPATRDRALAADWFDRFEGAGLDGVMAKPENGSYEPNKRSMLKVKHERDCDCVVAGFRWHKDMKDTGVGSLLLGLFDERGHLQHVGVAASFPMAKRKELVGFLAPYRAHAIDEHPWKEWAGHEGEGDRMPGMQSRWSGGKSMAWEPLRLELVCEVAYDHMQGGHGGDTPHHGRFRHTAQFRRWRDDKKPSDCTFAQLETTKPYELDAIFGKK
jgi:ATP-dependent DNA ligase